MSLRCRCGPGKQAPSRCTLVLDHGSRTVASYSKKTYDVKPHSCPNALNVKVQGSLPVAILGTESLNISQVDLASVRLEGVAPLTWSVADVATPYVPFVGKEEPTDCTDAGPDGFPDLKLKFAVPELIAALGEVADGDTVVVHLTGALKDEFGGTPIVGEDVVLILTRGKP